MMMGTRKARFLISGMIFTTVFSAAALSSTLTSSKMTSLSLEKYNECFKGVSTPLCQAFLAGIEHEQQRVAHKSKATALDKKGKSNDLLERALQQRAGGRYQASKLIDEN